MRQEEIEEMVSGQTVATLFRSTVAARPDAVALRWLAHDQLAGGLLTWAGYADQACRVAGGLADLGVDAGDRVILMMGNRPEFHVVDIACVLLGATPISIYNSSSPEQVAYLAGHADATVAVAGDGEQLDRLLRAWPSLPVRGPLIIVDDAAAVNGPFSYGQLLSAAPVDFDAAVERARPEDLATLIYTSGTARPRAS